MFARFWNIPICSVQIFVVCNPLLGITLDVHAQHPSMVSSRKLKTFLVSHPDRLCQCRGTRTRPVGPAVDTTNASIDRYDMYVYMYICIYDYICIYVCTLCYVLYVAIAFPCISKMHFQLLRIVSYCECAANM